MGTTTNPVYNVAPWERSWVPKGFHFKHWFQDASGGEGYGRGTDRQFLHQVQYASPPVAGRIARSIAESTPWPLLTDQDGATLGPLRFAAGSLAEFLAWVAQTEPENMRAAFGDEGQRLLSSQAWVEANNPDQDGGRGLTRFEWFRRGVYLSARAPWWQKAYFRYYDEHILDDAITAFKAVGGQSERLLALFARSRNSSKNAMNKARAAYSAARANDKSEAQAVEDAAAAYVAIKPGLYGDRIKKLWAAHDLRDVNPDISFARDLAIDGSPAIAQDGSLADYVSEGGDPLPWLTGLILLLGAIWK